jgi:hypothetical protein
MNTGLPTHGFRVTDPCCSKKNLKVTNLSLHAGTAGDRLLGSCFLPPRLTGAVYHDFLRNFIPELLQDVDLQTTRILWLIHDDAPSYFLLREFLNIFPAEWIG